VKKNISFRRAWPFVFLALLLVGSVSEGRAQTTGTKQGSVSSKLPLSPVIWVEHPGVVQEFTVDQPQARSMLNKALMTLTSAPDIATAWTRLGITPQDTVGIKITTDGGPALCTHHSLVQAICDGLRAAGVPSSQIIIWDKRQDKMVTAGYAPRAADGNKPGIGSVVPSNNYDPNFYYRSYTAGSLIWGDYRFMQSVDVDDPDSSATSTRSYFTKYVTETCTKLINVPVLTDNSGVGINGCMSSLALGSVDNNRRFQGPPFFGNPAIDEILAQDCIRRKVVVHILDALVAQCAGGPVFNPQFCQGLGALYVSRDPVAVDSLVLPRLEKLRRAMGVPPIGNAAGYIGNGANYHLGTTDHHRIQLVRLP
jgi:hypothetical protein